MDGDQVAWLLVPRSDRSSTERPGLTGALATLAAQPVRGRGAVELVHALAPLCGQALGDDVQLTLTLGDPCEPIGLASTGPTAQQSDGAQVMTESGPCVEAHRSHEVVTTDDASADPRWPALGRLLPPGVGGVVAVPLLTGGDLCGVLSVYRQRPGVDRALREAVETVALTVAALLRERDLEEEVRRAAEDMQQALRSRATIDQAKGIIMAQKGGTADEAFEHLRDLASVEHVKLRDLASAIVARARHGAH